jgi:hypothetical protein
VNNICNGKKTAVFWDVAIALMIEAVRSSEISVNIYQTTQCNTPENNSSLNVFDNGVILL